MLKINNHFFSEAKYHLGERKHSDKCSAIGAYIKNQAAREQRRNAKATLQWEMSCIESSETNFDNELRYPFMKEVL